MFVRNIRFLVLLVAVPICSPLCGAGSLYVSSYPDQTVSSYDIETGQFLETVIPPQPLPLAQLVIGPDQNLYAVAHSGDKIVRLNLTTDELVDFVPAGSGGLDAPTGMAFGPNGDLFVLSQDTHQILEYDGATGDFVKVFASTQSGSLMGIAFGPADHHAYVSIGRPFNEIRRYDGTTGDPLGVFVSPSEGRPDHPFGLAFGPGDDLYVVCNQGDEVLRYNGLTGQLIGPLDPGPGCPIGGPEHVEYASDGSLYVSCYVSGNVLCFSDGGCAEVISGHFGLSGLAVVLSTVQDITFYLHGVDPDLTLDGAPPTGATANYKDSPSLRRTDFKEIGTWTYAVPSGMPLRVESVSELHLWVGLKNSDDQGTYFDIRAELLKNGTAVASGEITNIRGVTRNANKAKEVVLDFAAIPEVEFGSGDVLSLRILTKVTDAGGHSGAVGLRLYYDSVSRPSRFTVTSDR